jgi:hypothetical protein
LGCWTPVAVLEDAFFRKRDAILAEQLHKLEKMKETKQALQKVSGITDEKVLDKLVALNVRPETLASLAMVPLVEIAWADGSIGVEERDAILKAAAKRLCQGRHRLCPHREPGWPAVLRIAYLKHGPTHSGALRHLNKTQIAHLGPNLIGHARDIAKASGGFLELGNKISSPNRP